MKRTEQNGIIIDDLKKDLEQVREFDMDKYSLSFNSFLEVMQSGDRNSKYDAFLNMYEIGFLAGVKFANGEL